MLPLAEWVNALPLTERLREIAWFGAMINVMHLVALAVFAGAVLLVDLRLMGAGPRLPAAQVARDARPFLIWGFWGLVATGLPQLMLAPIKEYYSDLFWLKMEIMLVAIVFTFFIRPRIAQVDEARLGPLWGKLAGLFSIVLWTGVAIPARLIGLVG
jgi:hypothetical protein